MGMSHDTFYRNKSAVDDGGVEALFERTRRMPNLASRVDEATEQAVIISAKDFPADGQARTSNELRKLGVIVSPSGVRSIWLRHDLANFKARLKAQEAKVAEEGGTLTETQVQALEKKKLEMRPAVRSRQLIPTIWDLRIRFTLAPIKALALFTSRLMTTPIARSRRLNFTPPVPRQNRPRRTVFASGSTRRSCKSFTRSHSAKKLYETVEALQADLDQWIDFYNTERTHHSKMRCSRTAFQMMIEGREIWKEKFVN